METKCLTEEEIRIEKMNVSLGIKALCSMCSLRMHTSGSFCPATGLRMKKGNSFSENSIDAHSDWRVAQSEILTTGAVPTEMVISTLVREERWTTLLDYGFFIGWRGGSAEALQNVDWKSVLITFKPKVNARETILVQRLPYLPGFSRTQLAELVKHEEFITGDERPRAALRRFDYVQERREVLRKSGWEAAIRGVPRPIDSYLVAHGLGKEGYRALLSSNANESEAFWHISKTYEWDEDDLIDCMSKWAFNPLQIIYMKECSRRLRIDLDWEGCLDLGEEKIYCNNAFIDLWKTRPGSNSRFLHDCIRYGNTTFLNDMVVGITDARFNNFDIMSNHFNHEVLATEVGKRAEWSTILAYLSTNMLGCKKALYESTVPKPEKGLIKMISLMPTNIKKSTKKAWIDAVMENPREAYSPGDWRKYMLSSMGFNESQVQEILDAQ